MECFSHDMGPVVRMARPENPNEIDESDHFRATALGTLSTSGWMRWAR